MSTSTVVAVLLAAYFVLNFLCALVLHVHAEHQAHLRHRFLDVAVHFLVLTAFALPALAFVLFGALFGSEKTTPVSPTQIANATTHARAA